MDRAHWAPVVDALIETLRECSVQGRRLDVRENVKFKGGNFVRWIHRTFPRSGCGVAIEFKKIFMDEWTGELNGAMHAKIREALSRTVTPVAEELAKIRRG
jgi:hypothetical protein